MSRFELRSLFQMYDRVSDGHLACEEFVELLDATCDGVSQEVAESVFRHLFENMPVDQGLFVSKFNSFWTKKDLWIKHAGKPPARPQSATQASPAPSPREMGQSRCAPDGDRRTEAPVTRKRSSTQEPTIAARGADTRAPVKPAWPTDQQVGAPSPKSATQPLADRELPQRTGAAGSGTPVPQPNAAWAVLPNGTRLPLVCTSLEVVSRGTQTRLPDKAGVLAAEREAWAQLHQALGALGQFRTPGWVAAELRRQENTSSPEAVLRGLAGLAAAIGGDPVRGVATLAALSSAQ